MQEINFLLKQSVWYRVDILAFYFDNKGLKKKYAIYYYYSFVLTLEM